MLVVAPAFASETGATDDTSPWTRRPLALEGHLGLGTPYGFYGVALDYAPSESFGLTGGLGRGVSGLLLGTMVRARAPVWRVAPYLELGLSVGRHESNGCVMECHREPATWRWKMAVWGMAGLGLDTRFADAFSLRVYVGAQKILNEGAGTCTTRYGDCESGPNDDITSAPYVGFAAGYAF